MPLDKYEHIWWRGVEINRWTAAALETWEDKMGSELTISQGSFRPWTPYSGSSHMGGGAADVWFWGADANHATKVGRDVGFACWWRTPYQGNWPNHIHCILIGDATASATGKWQVSQYKMGYNGLSGYQRDWQPYRPSPIKEFDYKAWEDSNVPLTRDEIHRIAEAVWSYKINDPRTVAQDKIETSEALNRLLDITDKINDNTKK